MVVPSSTALALGMAAMAAVSLAAPVALTSTVSAVVTPAGAGRQLVRTSLPLPAGLLREGQALTVSDGRRTLAVGLRVLTWHPADGNRPRSARRGLATFPYDFAGTNAVRFTFRPTKAGASPPRPDLPVQVTVEGETVTIAYRNGPTLTARLVGPAAQPGGTPAPLDTVESNRHYLWQRAKLPDAQWPRLIEIRADAVGGVVVVAHLQRLLPDDGYAPDLGWEIKVAAAAPIEPRASRETWFSPLSAWTAAERVQSGFPHLREISSRTPQEPVARDHTTGDPCETLVCGGKYRISHPTAPLTRLARIETQPHVDGSLTCRYLAYRAEEKAPQQPYAWRRAEFVVAPAGVAPLGPTLQPPHKVQIAPDLWNLLYPLGEGLNLEDEPELARLIWYHHDAVVRSMALGKDMGNVTTYADSSPSGGAFGMNRLNHCSAIYEQYYRSGDARLRDTALLWCDNFHDQSIWWGPEGTGGTRYNNVVAMGREPFEGDRSYMWRSNSAVDFCTKGYDAFFLAYEETGDPLMLEALTAQVAYVTQHLHADRAPGEARNVGDVRDFIRLYDYTGEQRYLDEALRLFRELRTRLSPGDLFSQGGLPIGPDPPFIDDDDTGYKHPFAKPYIIGYALAGLPELARHCPDEPKLRSVVQAVADFLADSQDPLGGWRYPHPRSSYLILSQGIEHAWQIVQADRFLGPQEKHLDAIERVLRQRIWGWKRTGQTFEGLDGWEITTGKVKSRAELYQLYQRPADRDPSRDYTEGRPSFGSSPPEGLVYFTEVLALYLKHRSPERLLAPPKPDEPLGLVLNRVPAPK